MTQADTIVRLHGLPRVPSLEGRQVLVTSEQDVPSLGTLRSLVLRSWHAIRAILGLHQKNATLRAEHERALLKLEAARAELARAIAIHQMTERTVTAADQIRQEMTVARLERVMELATSAGIEVHAVQLPGGGIGIALEGPAEKRPAAESAS
jgi:hypothetical protein